MQPDGSYAGLPDAHRPTKQDIRVQKVGQRSKK